MYRAKYVELMCSYDVVSLCTNIPLEEMITICHDTLFRDGSVQKPHVPEELLRKLLLKATTEVEFSFQRCYLPTGGRCGHGIAPWTGAHAG